MEKWHKACNLAKSLSTLVLFSGVIFLYLFLTSPGKVALSDTGEVSGIQNLVREFFQGKKFWKDQLFFIDNEIKDTISIYEEIASISEESSKINSDVDKIVEGIFEKAYAENPGLRPSHASQKANDLRKEADRIDRDEGFKFIGGILYQRVLELRKIRPIVDSKAR